MDDFKKGVELFAIAIGIFTAVFALWAFFANRASSPLEHILTNIYVVIVTAPLTIVAGMSLGASMSLMFPNDEKMYYLFQAISLFATIGFILIIFYTDIDFSEPNEKDEGGLSYGIHSIHNYTNQEAWDQKHRATEQ